MTNEFRADIATIEKISAVPLILDVVCRTTGMGFAAVARVTEDRWIACAVRDEIQFGLKPGGELKVETTICNEIRQSGNGVIIDHVAEDDAFCGHPTPAMYGFQSYISMPIVRSDGSFFGTLCSIDPRPARVKNPQIIGMFKLFADLIAFHLDTVDRLASSQATIDGARLDSELREQFIAVLGHDLRNPLASIKAGAELLQRGRAGDKTEEVLRLMQASVSRMAALIDNVLDFARGRLGEGIDLSRRDTDLEPVLRHVVEELRSAHAGRPIEAEFVLQRPVYCDSGRIAQLLSNLLANALTHGAADSPIRVAGRLDGDTLELTVANRGNPIAPETLAKLFQPFFRGGVRRSQQGLGLGLYISAEVARAHGGTLQAASTNEETRFTLRIPATSRS